MAEDNKQIFRQTSLERIASPERTDDYLCLPVPGRWIVLFACALLAAGAAVWLLLGAA